MAHFLSGEWFDELNESLTAAGPVPLAEPGGVVRVVLEFLDAPTSRPHALTFTLRGDGASVEAGDHLAADAIVRLSYDDALALSEGTLDSAGALREGRLKIRGDVNALVPLTSWLQAAHPHAATVEDLALAEDESPPE